MNDFKKADKINLALIATYPKMYRILHEIAAEEDIILHNVFASFDDAVVAAKEIEPQVDAILSRGGTCEYIRKAVNIPVISIPISPFDLVQSILNLPIRDKEIAFLNFQRNIYGVREIERMFDIIIHEYTFIDKIDIINSVRDVKKRGIKSLIGGELAASLAIEEGIRGVEISAGQEAIHRALHETIQLVRIRKEEINRAARLKVVLDSLSEGIMVTDEQKTVTMINPAAQRIFNVTQNSAIGKNAEDIVTDIEMDQAFRSRVPVSNYIKKLGENIITINHYPVQLDKSFIGIVSTFEDVTKIQTLENKIRKKLYDKGFVAKYTFNNILTKNKQMIAVKELAQLYAKTKSAILIEGESGTGKELFAHSIHNASQCAEGPFVAINCAAIQEQLLESELFGYEAGAFTGAKKEGKTGLFELAHNGTIFLDEIGEIPMTLQTRLLRVVQEKEIMRVGGDKIIPVNIRIVSATNKNLKDKVEKGEFREDLYYRLNIFNIKIPPLRERREDIELLVRWYLNNKVYIKKEDEDLISKLMPALTDYQWPGNIRELINAIERVSLLFGDYKYKNNTSSDLLKAIQVLPDSPAESQDEEILFIKINIENGLKKAVNQAERQIIHSVLEQCSQDQEVALKKLDIGKTTLWRKLNSEG